jgi:hypothetical protein
VIRLSYQFEPSPDLRILPQDRVPIQVHIGGFHFGEGGQIRSKLSWHLALSSLSRSVTPSRSCAYKSDECLLDLSRAITLAGSNGSSQVSDVRWPPGDSSKTDATVILCSTLLPRGKHPCSGCQDNGYLDAASMVPTPLRSLSQHCEALRPVKQTRATILNETYNAPRNGR